jgi:hypothetical protein
MQNAEHLNAAFGSHEETNNQCDMKFTKSFKSEFESLLRKPYNL